jgi:integrase
VDDVAAAAGEADDGGMDLASRVVATQLGHSSPRLVELLYGHFKVGALEEIDRALERMLWSIETQQAHTAPSTPLVQAEV